MPKKLATVKNVNEIEKAQKPKKLKDSKMITLIPTKPEYAETCLKWRSEPNMLRYNPVTQISLEELLTQMKTMGSDFSDLFGVTDFRFFLQFQNQLVGTIGLKNISRTMLHAELGYAIGEEFQGRGFGTLAVQLFVEKIFTETALHRIFAYVAEENFASRRLLEKVGFIQEGICREHFIINGNPTNEVLYGFLRSDLKNI